MTEQAPQPPTGTPPPEQPTTTPEKPDATGSGRYAAYDKRLLKYVGGVHDSKTAARDAGKDAGTKAADIRVDEV